MALAAATGLLALLGYFRMLGSLYPLASANPPCLRAFDWDMLIKLPMFSWFSLNSRGPLYFGRIASLAQHFHGQQKLHFYSLNVDISPGAERTMLCQLATDLSFSAFSGPKETTLQNPASELASFLESRFLQNSPAPRQWVWNGFQSNIPIWFNICYNIYIHIYIYKYINKYYTTYLYTYIYI